MSSSEVIGYWRPLEGCNPYIGNEGEISKEPEIKVEVTVFTEAVDRTIEAIKKSSPVRRTGDQCNTDPENFVLM